MWFDDTPRLFSVAEILKKKKNKEDNYEIDDFPDVKKQELTGKYDTNFDALGSDFERAHNYNLNNIQQPENTKSEVEYSDKYSNFFKYEPSTYVKLEEDEYKPFSKYDEKANEYYIDNLKGKTLDDLIISKMKENAGAEDLPRDASRRKFAEDLMNQELPSFSSIEFSAPEEEIREQRTRSKKSILRNLNAKIAGTNNVIIEAPLSSANRRSDRVQGLSATGVSTSPEPAKPRGRYVAKKQSSSSSAQHPTGMHPPTAEEIKNNPFIQNILNQSKERGFSRVDDILNHNAVKSAFDKLKKNPKKQKASEEQKENTDNEESGGGGGKSSGNDKSSKKDEKKDDKKAEKKGDDKDDNSGGKTLSKEEARDERAKQAQARLEQQEQERIHALSENKRLEVYQALIPKLGQYKSDKQLEPEDWLTYQGLMKFHKVKTGNIPKSSTAVKNLQEKLKDAIESLKSTVNQTKLQRIQENETIAGNKLEFSSDLKNIKSSGKTLKTPVGKVQTSENRSKSPVSPKKAIDGLISHINPVR